MPDWEQFNAAVYDLIGFRLSGAQISSFQHYLDELLEWNERFNLTAIRQPDEILSKHFLDSLTCLLAWPDRPPARLIDIGTGAGFPGLPLKLLLPDLQLTLVESVGKKADFCRHVAETLCLEGVTVVTARAEELGQDRAHRQGYDWAVARAVAHLPILAEYLLPLARVGGGMLAQKGSGAPEEAQSARRAVAQLGGQLRELVPVHLPGLDDQRYLVIADKIGPTPAAFPRRVGIPSKKPLG